MSDALTQALLAAVTAEDAAIYGYSLAGARLASREERSVARGNYDVHREQRQAVAGWLESHGATPPPPAVQYSPSEPVHDAASASALLTKLEEATAARYVDIVAVSTGSLQRSAALALQAAAIREAHWRGTCVPYPGLVDRLPAN